MRYFLLLTFSLAVWFVAQTLALRASGGRTIKSDSNFFSSLGRIQAGAHSRQKIMVLGSSITGRIPDSAQGFSGISNMGCDGGHGIDTLRAIDQGIIPSAPWIFIEANTLGHSLTETRSEVSRAMTRPWFRLGIEIPSISAYSRPSAFFYSKLLESKIGSFRKEDAERGFGTGTNPTKLHPALRRELTPIQNQVIAEVSGVIARLRQNGSQFIFVWLPPARAETRPPDWILSLAEASNSYWWDLAQAVPKEEVRLTDSVHMDATSATRTTGDLLRAIEHLEQIQQLGN